MITKEQQTKKYCCLYASDFHLEMILLPYIKNNIDNTKFKIFTQTDLSKSMKILLNRTNLNIEEKNEMMKLDWKINKKEKIERENLNNCTVIINGDNEYIKNINDEINKKQKEKITIIDCYKINENNNFKTLYSIYDEILNTKNYKKK